MVPKTVSLDHPGSQVFLKNGEKRIGDLGFDNLGVWIRVGMPENELFFMPYSSILKVKIK